MRLATLVGVSVAAFLSASSVRAQDAIADLTAHSAHISRAAAGQSLARPGLARSDAVRDALANRHDAATLRGLAQGREHESGGIVHLTFTQQIAGLDVFGTYVRAAFAANGDLVSLVENLVETSAPLRPSQITERAALQAVLARYYPAVSGELPERSVAGNVVAYASGGPFRQGPTVTRIAIPLTGQRLDSGYLVETWDRSNVLRHTVVSGRGEVLRSQLRTASDSYRAFPVNPGVSGQALVTSPANPLASPIGWLGLSTTTTGNNVDAYLDRNDDDLPDVNGRPVAPDQVFDYAWDGTAEPTTTVNQQLAVTNLFYLTNLIHDRLYGYGFTESAGNFQTDNFGRGGADGDPLNAEAQDGGATDNANFATPDDGLRPRMQMYLWDQSTPGRDGSLDSDIVFHEYTHGLTWRMVGDMSNAPASAVGEGMSDAIACYFNNDDRVAEWSSNNPIGIRTAPYTNYTRTYGQVVGVLGPHLDGEIYAATLWRLRQLWLGKGWSTETLLRYLVDGLNYTPPLPAYEQMRDGILTSIQQLPTGLDTSQATCAVWDAFAQFGIGVGASGQEICAIGLCFFQATESFTEPAGCGGTGNAAPTVQISSPANGAAFTSGASVAFSGSASDTEDGTLTASLAWSSSLQGSLGTGASFSRSDLVVGTHVIVASVTDSQGASGSASVTITVNPPPNTAPTVSISQPTNGATFTKGQSVAFAGSASDAQDGNLSASIAWSSSLQGAIGTGATFSRSDLVAGAHIITAKVTDSGTLSQTAQVAITISNFTLSATKTTVKGKRQVALSWAGATGSTVGVYRNNALLVNTANDGSYTDANLPKKGTAFTYKVCLAATPSVCSNTVSVTF